MEYGDAKGCPSCALSLSLSLSPWYINPDVIKTQSFHSEYPETNYNLVAVGLVIRKFGV
jgi:hypothetical protein